MYEHSSGLCIIPTPVSIEDHLQKQLLQDVFDFEGVTDYESSGSGEELEGSPGSSKALVHGDEGCPPKAQLFHGQSRKVERRKELGNRRRRQKRQRAQDKEGTKGVCKRRMLESTSNTLQLDFSLENAGASTSGWIGRCTQGLPLVNPSLQGVMDRNDLRYFPWDGYQTHLLIDRGQHVVGVLYAWPKDHKGWQKALDEAFDALKKASIYFNSKPTKPHRRGVFPLIAQGISYGGGQEEPGHLSHSSKTNGLLNELLEQESIQRLCNNASHAFKVYGKRNYQYMKDTMEALRLDMPSLRRPYDHSIGVYPCRSFNLGCQSVAYPHVDVVNLAQSWCSITPVGSFDAKAGGHLILGELGLVVEFPPGSTILIPSALITHSNTPIQPNETRFSIVQYAAGGLFRWVENGFMSDIAWKEDASKEQMEQHEKSKNQRWKKALDMFTKLDELLPEGTDGAA